MRATKSTFTWLACRLLMLAVPVTARLSVTGIMPVGKAEGSLAWKIRPVSENTASYVMPALPLVDVANDDAPTCPNDAPADPEIDP
jgi:hypothetical protein